ncbi:DUF945 family protein [Escherichia coli]
MSLFKEYLPLLQKSEPTIKQPKRHGRTHSAKLNANPDISIAYLAKSSSSTNKDIKSLNFDVKLPLNVVTETAKQLNLSEGMDAEKAQTGDKQISGMMTLGQMFQLITIDNNTASLQLRYTPGKVVFNGQEMSEEEFMSRAGRFVH